MINQPIKRSMIALVTASGLWCAAAEADTLSAVGGLGFGRNTGHNEIKSPTPLLGVEYTFSLSRQIQIGGFYDHEQIHYLDKGLGKGQFKGLTVHLYARDSALSGPFLFAKAGLFEQSLNEEQSANRPGCGVGAGFQMVLSKSFSLDPRFGVRFLPDSFAVDAPSRAIYDSSFMISFHF